MKRSIALLYLGLLFSVYSQVSYEYRFDKADSSATYLEEHSSASNPKIHINGSNSPPMIVPMGLLYGDNSASLINTSPYLPMTKPFTVTFWVYLFRTDQEAYLISRYQSSGSYIGLKIKNGKLVTVSKGGASATTETTSSSMYKVGWNTISLSFHTTSFVMRGMSRFGTLNVETFAEQAVGSSNEVSIGGSIQGSSVVQSLSGIINRMWYYGGQISDVTFQTLYSFTSSCSMKCDHYIAMLYDMTEFRPGTTDQFKDPLYDLGTYSYYQCEMSYYGAGTPAASLGISLNSSNDEKIKSADTRFDSSYSLGVEFWIKGTPFATDSFVYFKNRSNNKVLLMLTKNNAGGLNINNGYQAVVTVANVFATWVNTEWTYISASLGPTKNANEFGACVVIKQSSYIDFTTCLYNTGIQNGVNTVDNINLRIGGGFDGYMKELYVYTGMLRVDSLIEQQGLVNWYPNRKLYPCHITDYLEEPHCISEGCGNGIINSTIDTAITEYCDDGNNDDDDGCSSTCEVEDLYECPISEAIDISMCTFVCGDGELDTSVGEECDDGDTGSLDGCSSICEVEDGWSCTTTNGALSVCTANCGDGLKVAGEACEDGGTDDTSGCLDDCSGPVNGYTCSGGDLSNPDTCVETCGDGYRTENEDCDDNDTDTGDGCDDNCEVEDGWTCTSTLGALSTCSAASCGDGYRVGAESCDDNNNDNTEGCLADCSGSVNGYTCSGGDGSGPDTCTETCGDGYLTVSEECDDNDTDTGDGCDDNCEVEDGWSCTNTIGALSTCSAASCGDGYRVGAEVCDDNNNDNTEGCLADCTGSVDGYTCSGGDGSGPDTCTEVCGDGYLTVSEECDDNDTDTHDGCDDNCEVEDGWTCTSTLGATSTCSAASCGDGYRVGSEVCDDNNNDDTEGCLADCTGAVNGYTCTGGDGSGPDTCIEDCGDGYLTASEECDDNDTDTGDGCDDNCEVENGWTCTSTLGATSTCSAASCGDGYRVGSEVCDDNNNDDTEGCLADCTGAVNGFTCTGGDGSGPDTCIETCGDGYLTASEECDDNDTDTGDGCDDNCEVEDGWSCTNTLGALSTCSAASCGDGYKVGAEVCDDGNSDNTEGCLADCTGSVNGYTCSGGGGSGPDTCIETCGDGYLTASEECDDNDTDTGDGCDDNCEIEDGWACTNTLGVTSTCSAGSCGDGYKVGAEVCDDGNTDNNEGCLADCTGSVNGYTCSGGDGTGPDTCTEDCGDGYRTTGEECDDNDPDDLDGCDSNCQIEDGWTCSTVLGTTSSCTPDCGDSRKVAGETCDDGNTDGDSGCNADCSAFVSGWSCANGDINTADDCTSTCGDGIKTTDEECDDNDLDDLDGCDSNCIVEAGWDCTQVLHAQSSCVLGCGGGFKDAIEECDDGNSIDIGDGCTNDCIIESGWKCAEDITGKSICIEKCGDGVVDDDEECDDKNTRDSGDGCTNQCKIENGWKCGEDILGASVCFPKCGDGEVDEGEECDDENTSDGDGCSSSCHLEPGYNISNNGEVLIAPTVSLVSISKLNIITVEFSQSMAQFDINALEDALNVSIEGPMSSYSFTYRAEFTSSTQMELHLTLNKQIVGRKEETCNIKFNQSRFKSTKGANLGNESVSGFIYQKQVAAEAIEQGGTATSSILGITLGTIILSNVLLGDEIELLWGFMNTLQIITYFPFLQLYLPQFLNDFIESLSISNLKISIGFVDDAVQDFQDYWIGNDDYDLATEDDTYKDNDIDSMSVVRNAAAIMTILIQGLLVCMIAYAIKAKFITVHDEMNKKAQHSQSSITSRSLYSQSETKQIGLKAWIKNKIIDICDGYKYHFFIRLGFQLYLEATLLTFLNLSVIKFSNWAHYVSYCVAIIFAIILILVSICVYKYNVNNYRRIRRGTINGDNPLSILYHEYKTSHIMFLQYHTFFMLRRMGYAFCIVFLKNWPFYQNCGVVLLFVSKWSYQVVFRPYKNTVFNVIMTINESTLTAISCLFYLYVESSTNTDLADRVGWVILYSIAIVIILNILTLWSIKITSYTKRIVSYLRSQKKNRQKNKINKKKDDQSNKIAFKRSKSPFKEA